MRRITNPEHEKPAVEDVKISCFDFDAKDNIAVQDTMIEVPTGFGRFAKAAMIKGFFEYFDKAMPTYEANDPKRQLMQNAIDKELEMLKKVVANIESRIPTEAQEPVSQ